MGNVLNALKSVLDYVGVVVAVIGLIGTILSFARRNSALMRRLRAPFIFLLALSLVVGGILLANRPVPPPAFPNAAADQTIKVWTPSTLQDVPTLDPASAGDTLSYQVTSLVFPNLLVLDQHLQLKPWAAKSFTRSDDGKVYRFTLWSGMKWSDGTPITAHSFAYAINRTLSPCTQSPIARYLFALRDARAFNAEACHNGVIQGAISQLFNDPQYDSIVVPDDQTIVFNLPQAAPYFLYALTYACAAAVPGKAADAGWTDHLTDQRGFSGNLFRITQHGGGTITLERNDTFWGAKPELSKIVFDLGSDGTQDDVACPDATKCTIVPTLSINYAAMNWTKAPFDDVRMRQAFALALDKTKLADPSYGKATNHIVPEGMPDYSNPSLVGPDDTQSVTGDITKAQSLAQAYAQDKCDGDLNRCAPVTLTYSSGFSNTADVVLKAWQAAFPALSIQGNQVDLNAFADPAYVKTFQFWLLGWGADYPDPQDFLSLQFLPEGFATTSSPTDVEDLMRQADVDLDPPTRTREYQNAEQTLVSQVAWIPLDQQLQPVGFQKYVVNYAITAFGIPSLDAWQRIYLTRH
jgi:peptide/nickel transport system substrate-binding protein/oligopeptide transport system substrate-binding protein